MIQGGLLIRADASPEMGSGHIMRCLALAQAWQGPVHFAVARGRDIQGDRLRKEHFPVLAIDEEPGSPIDARATIELARSHGAGWIMLDGYHFTADYLTALGEGPARVLMMDDEGRDALGGVDLLLNQNIHAAPELYPRVPPATILLLGNQFTLLRREFLASGPTRDVPTELQPLKRVLITLGGGGTAALAGRMARVIGMAGPADLEIRVLVGGGDRGRAEALARVEGRLPRVEVLNSVEDMPAQYGWAQLAVTAGGGTLWELAYLGVPALTVIIAENQEPSSRVMHERGAIHCLGWQQDLTDDHLAGEFQDLAADTDRRRNMIRAGREIIDGQGPQRVMAVMAASPPKEGCS
jgi:UDP-2,4-diacetamido-2,4,6-trideoxy-beta-L-altropyranose hydrolase